MKTLHHSEEVRALWDSAKAVERELANVHEHGASSATMVLLLDALTKFNQATRMRLPNLLAAVREQNTELSRAVEQIPDLLHEQAVQALASAAGK